MGNSSSLQVVPNRQQRRPNAAEKPDPSSPPLVTTQTGIYPQLILFGDSITQNATLTLQPRLQALYVRRADVINRGFSGYNSVLALKILPCFLPFSPSVPLTSQPSVRLVTLFLGANDAALPSYAQHVPLPLYTANLERIVQYVLFQQHRTKIVMITPAPVDEWQLEKPLSRTAINTRRYAQAAKEVAEKLNLPCVDLWATFAGQCGYRDASNQDSLDRAPIENRAGEATEVADGSPSGSCLPAATDKTDHAPEALPGSLSAPRNEVLASLLNDGLHFTPQGYDLLYNELVTVIRTQVPECLPENMPSIFESWRDILGVPKKNTDIDPTTTNPCSDAALIPSTHPARFDTKYGLTAKSSTVETTNDVRVGDSGIKTTEIRAQMDGTTSKTRPYVRASPCEEMCVGDIRV